MCFHSSIQDNMCIESVHGAIIPKHIAARVLMPLPPGIHYTHGDTNHIGRPVGGSTG